MNFEEELKSLKEQIKFDKKFLFPEKKNIVISGMGGSGIVGKIIQDLYSEKPIVVINDYSIPEFVDKDTLFIAVSYSGNTEETITSTLAAIKKGAAVFAITTGGRLGQIAENKIIIPSGIQPRSALGYMTLPILNSLNAIRKDEIEELYNLLKELDESHDEALEIAKEIFARNAIPVIYGIPPYFAVSYRWKTQFNENAKILAYSSNFSELNHNDTMPLKLTYRKDEFYFICFRDGLDKRIEKRIEVTQQITDTKFRYVFARGSTPFVREFYLIHFGDWVSFLLGKLRGQDPQDVSLIEELKQRLENGP
jgi:glucose/mannose-6-phosphate isomerase